MFWERVIVRDQERLLISKNGRFDRILLPGEYRIRVAPFVSLEREKHSVFDLVFRSSWADYLLRARPEVVEQHFTRVETNDAQVGIVYVNSELFTVLVPSKRLLFWRGQANVTAEMIEVVAENDPPAEMFEAVLSASARAR